MADATASVVNTNQTPTALGLLREDTHWAATTKGVAAVVATAEVEDPPTMLADELVAAATAEAEATRIG
jgi:hypothetical protein